MKKFLLILFAALLLATPVSAMSNMQLIKRYCKQNYPEKQIRIVQQGKLNYKQFTHRKGKRYVYVIKFRAKSRGDYGITKTGSYIRFNNRVKKGKWVYMYYVYNPYSNYEDDVVARIGNSKIVTFS